MRSVGIKQLKARLSEYVRLAKGGETVLVTDRDQVVAQLGPAQFHRPPAGSLDEILDQLAAEGHLTRAERPKEKGWTWKVRGMGLPAGTAQRLLDEIREDRV